MRILLCLCTLLSAAGIARAEEGPFPWRGSFLEAEAGAHRRMYGPFGPAFEARYVGFPGDDDPHRLLVLGGVRWERNRHSWMELKLGYARTWLRDRDEDRFAIGVRKRWEFPSLRLHLRLEQDHTFRKTPAGTAYDYHGDYAVSYRLIDLLTPEDQAAVRGELKPVVRGQTVGVKGTMNPLEVRVGFRADHRWSDVDLGPHLVFTRPQAPWQFEIQHFSRFWGPEQGHSAHFVLRLHL